MSKPFDINKLTMLEIDTVEQLSGMPIAALSDEDKPKGKVLAALAFVAKRRDNPEYTFNDAFGLTMQEAMEAIGLNPAEVAVDPDDSIAAAEAGADSPKGARKR